MIWWIEEGVIAYQSGILTFEWAREFDRGYVWEAIENVIQKMKDEEIAGRNGVEMVEKAIMETGSIRITWQGDTGTGRWVDDHFVVQEGTGEWTLPTSYVAENRKSWNECMSSTCKDCGICDAELQKTNFWWLNEILKGKRAFIYYLSPYEGCWSIVVQGIDNQGYKEYYCASDHYDKEQNKLYILGSDDSFAGEWTFGLLAIDVGPDGIHETQILKDLNSIGVHIEGNYLYYMYDRYDEPNDETHTYLVAIQRYDQTPVLQRYLGTGYQSLLNTLSEEHNWY